MVMEPVQWPTTPLAKTPCPYCVCKAVVMWLPVSMICNCPCHWTTRIPEMLGVIIHYHKDKLKELIAKAEEKK